MAAVPVPTTIVTGYLGSGKTTVVRSLLARKPPGERWAVLINEFGEVGLDEAIVLGDAAMASVMSAAAAESAAVCANDGVSNGRPELVVREIAGGCFCCTTALALELALVSLLDEVQPHRLLIEPSGFGHPAGVVDVLRSSRFASRVDLRGVIGLVDPRDLQAPQLRASTLFADQLQMADVVAITKADVTPADDLARAVEWVAALDPPKSAMATIAHGQVELSWLDAQAALRVPFAPHPSSSPFREAHPPGTLEPTSVLLTTTLGSAHAIATATPTALLVPGQPVRRPHADALTSGCGWIFSPRDCFARERLLELIDELGDVERFKGIFRTESDWLLIQRKGWQLSVEPTGYRRDSRAEVLLDYVCGDWGPLEQALLNCRITSE